MTVTRRTAKANQNHLEFLSVHEVAERWALGHRYVRRLIDAHELPATRFGRAIRVRLADVIAYESEHESDPTR